MGFFWVAILVISHDNGIGKLPCGALSNPVIYNFYIIKNSRASQKKKM